MKHLTKQLAAILAVATLFFTSNAKAQSGTSYGKFNFDIGLEAGAPLGNAHTYLSNVALGGTARLQVGVSSNLALIVTSGYYNMFNKNVTFDGATSKSPGLGIVPVKGGLKGFLGGGVYFTGEAGAGFETSRDDDTNQKDVKLILSPGLGYAMQSWDIGVHYDSFTGQGYNYGLVALRLAYSFGSTKKSM